MTETRLVRTTGNLFGRRAVVEVFADDVQVKENDGAESLILCRRGDVELVNVVRTQFSRMSLGVV